MRSPVPPESILRQEPWRAILAFIDLHIADTTLNLDLDDGALNRFMDRYEANLVSGPGISKAERRVRKVTKLGVVEARQKDLLGSDAVVGQQAVERICGWVEHGKSHGKRYTLFHVGEAGLTQLECQVLDLSQRFITESGKPDFVRICQFLTTDAQPMTRQSALHALRRARLKLQRHLTQGDDQ